MATPDEQRNQILQAMAALPTMEYGSLKAECRRSADRTQLGPYYQHQVWRQGRNLSRRVPAAEAHRLSQAINNRQACEQLSAQFIALTVQQTRRAWGRDTKKTPLRPSPNPSPEPSISFH